MSLFSDLEILETAKSRTYALLQATNPGRAPCMYCDNFVSIGCVVCTP